MGITISNGNSKLGAIQSISLPRIVCNHSLPCYKAGCYAKKGNFIFDNVQKAYENNYHIYMDEPTSFEKQLITGIHYDCFFRWHVSGDIINKEYFKMMVRVANKRKDVHFLAFTKKYAIVNSYLANGGKIPKNLKVVFSAWKGLEFDNRYKLPVAYVRDDKDPDERITKAAFACPGSCTTCHHCFDINKRQSVVFHKH